MCILPYAYNLYVCFFYTVSNLQYVLLTFLKLLAAREVPLNSRLVSCDWTRGSRAASPISCQWTQKCIRNNVHGCGKRIRPVEIGCHNTGAPGRRRGGGIIGSDELFPEGGAV